MAISRLNYSRPEKHPAHGKGIKAVYLEVLRQLANTVYGTF